MRRIALAFFAVFLCISPVDAHGTDAFATTAHFKVDESVTIDAKGVVVSVEPHPQAPQYEWLILNFFAEPVTTQEIESAKAGDFKPLDDKIYAKGTEAYNTSHAKFILGINPADGKIWQADISVPGYSCTVAYMPEQLEKLSKDYIYADGSLQMKNKDSYNCEMGGKTHVFNWDFDVNAPVFKKVKK